MDKTKTTNILLVVIAVLLVILLAVNLATAVDIRSQRIEADLAAIDYAERATAARTIVEVQNDIIFDLMSDYQADVYDNPNVDRIAEQQLIAEEYQLAALQALAIQNGQVIELLASGP